MRVGWHDDLDGVIREFKAEDKADAELAAVRTELESQGRLRVTDERVGFTRASPVRYLTDLRDETGEGLNVEQHPDCPGHAMVLEFVEYYVKADGTLVKDKAELTEDDRARPRMPTSEARRPVPQADH